MQHKAGFINKLSRPLGIEVEFSKCEKFSTLFKRPSKWQFVHDGTLTYGGQELVIPPACGDAFLRQIAVLCRGLDKYPARVDDTCGFHVHVQAADLGMFELRRLIILWCGIEKDVFTHLVEPQRRENIYCQPMSVTAEELRHDWQFRPDQRLALFRERYSNKGRLKVHLIKKLYGISLADPAVAVKGDAVAIAKARAAHAALVAKFESIKMYKRTPGDAHAGGCRYAAMNLHSYFHRHPSTVEFRLKEGTIDPMELVMWPIFCGWVVEMSTRVTDEVAMSVGGLGDWCGVAQRVGVQQGVVDWVKGRIK
jgi:hypothetical protein